MYLILGYNWYTKSPSFSIHSRFPSPIDIISAGLSGLPDGMTLIPERSEPLSPCPTQVVAAILVRLSPRFIQVDHLGNEHITPRLHFASVVYIILGIEINYSCQDDDSPSCFKELDMPRLQPKLVVPCTHVLSPVGALSLWVPRVCTPKMVEAES